MYRISGWPDIRPFFHILYPAGYPVSFAGYPAGRITGYPVKLLNKRCELRKRTYFGTFSISIKIRLKLRPNQYNPTLNVIDEGRTLTMVGTWVTWRRGSSRSSRSSAWSTKPLAKKLGNVSLIVRTFMSYTRDYCCGPIRPKLLN